MRHVKIERSTKNPSGVVKGTVESQSLKVKSKIKIRDTTLEHQQRGNLKLEAKQNQQGSKF